MKGQHEVRRANPNWSPTDQIRSTLVNPLDNERKQDARGAGRLAVSLHPDLLRAWQRKTFETHNNLAIVRYFNLNRIMHNVRVTGVVQH